MTALDNAHHSSSTTQHLQYSEATPTSVNIRQQYTSPPPTASLAPVYLSSIPSQTQPTFPDSSQDVHNHPTGHANLISSRTAHSLPQVGVNIAIPLKPPVIMPSPLNMGDDETARGPPPSHVDRSGKCNIALQTSFSATPSKGMESESTKSVGEEEVMEHGGEDEDHSPDPVQICHTAPLSATPMTTPPSAPPPLGVGSQAEQQRIRPGVTRGKRENLNEEEAAESLSAMELDSKINRHLQDRASEWVQKELLTRMLISQQQVSTVPIPYDAQGSPPNSCSTCTPDNLQHARPHAMARNATDLPGGEELGEEELRGVVMDELCAAIRSLSGREGYKESTNIVQSVNHNKTVLAKISPTPPASSSTSSPSPISTPPHSPQAQSLHQHSISETDNAGVEEAESEVVVATPSATPSPLRKSASPIYDVTTPQETYSSASASSVGSQRSSTEVVVPEVATPPLTSVSISSLQPSSPQDQKEPEMNQEPPAESRPDEPLQLSLSASSTEMTSSALPSSLTPSTTDRQISMGEAVIHKRPLLGVTSLSEGEVPLSPGDARWYALYKSKIEGSTSEGSKMWSASRQLADHSSTMEAFLDLKNSPDPTSSSEDTSLLSGSSILDNMFSLGEHRGGRPLRGGRNQDGTVPIYKFASSSTHNNEEESNDTLSNLPSLREQDLDNGSEKGEDHMTSSPLLQSKPDGPSHTSRLKKTKKRHSHRVQFPLDVTAIWSKSAEGISTDFSDGSAGEVPVIIRRGWGRIQSNSSDGGGAGVLDESVNRQRNGIDVIDISASEKRSEVSGTEISDSMKVHSSAPSKILPAISPQDKVVEEAQLSPNDPQTVSSSVSSQGESHSVHKTTSSEYSISVTASEAMPFKDLPRKNLLQYPQGETVQPVIERTQDNNVTQFALPTTGIKMVDGGRALQWPILPRVQEHTSGINSSTVDLQKTPASQRDFGDSRDTAKNEPYMGSLATQENKDKIREEFSEEGDMTVSSIPEEIIEDTPSDLSF